MSRTKITTILGTRPELIRLSSIIKCLDELFDHRLVHTGQNSDPNLSKVFFKELEIREPDLYLAAPNSSLGKFLGNLFSNIESEFDKNPPEAVIILGDTNSALAGIIAKRRGIPVYHLEAGNRSFDQNVPEETNRRILDHLADFNLAYTGHAKDNLISEGVHPRNIAVIGSPLFEVINKFKSEIHSSRVLEKLKLKTGEFFLVSAHRQENVDDPSRLSELISSLNQIAQKFQFPVIMSTHPRTRDKLNSLKIQLNPLIAIHEPFGFIDYCKLQKEARIVLSDSGSVSEEAVILGFKAITIRDSMERPEALEAGSVLMGGIREKGLIECIKVIELMPISKSPPPDYLISDTSTRVINFITSTIHQHGFWSGLRKK